MRAQLHKPRKVPDDLSDQMRANHPNFSIKDLA
jgi:hypothetical protein